jgi:hypothetical protein
VTASWIYDAGHLLYPLLAGSTTSTSSFTPSPTGCTTSVTLIGPQAGTTQMAHRAIVVPSFWPNLKK